MLRSFPVLAGAHREEMPLRKQFLLVCSGNAMKDDKLQQIIVLTLVPESVPSEDSFT